MISHPSSMQIWLCLYANDIFRQRAGFFIFPRVYREFYAGMHSHECFPDRSITVEGFIVRSTLAAKLFVYLLICLSVALRLSGVLCMKIRR